MQYLWLAIFVFVSALHLVFCFLEKEKLRKYTKCLLMPLLMAYVIQIQFSSFEYSLIIALFIGFLGDLFLIFKDNKVAFVAGLSSFLIGHLFYLKIIISLLGYSSQLIIAVVILLIGCLFGYKFIKKITKNLTVPVLLYTFILLFEAYLALLLVIDNASLASFLVLGGVILFNISDAILAFTLFIKDFPKRDFYIMLSYILAQGFLTLGILSFLLI